MKLKDFEVKPTDRCPICDQLFKEGEPCFRGSHMKTGAQVTIHALCAFTAVKEGEADFDGVLGKLPIGEA